MINLKANMQTELASLPFIQADFRLTQFNGGTVNSSYRLDSGKNSYFVKTFESDEVNLLDRERLFNIQHDLAAKGLSVLPVYLSQKNHFQIDQWLDQPTLDSASLSGSEITKRLASILAHIHSLDVKAAPLDLPSEWEHYLEITRANSQHISTDKVRSMANIWRNACSERATFCHNDLALAHVTDSQTPVVFDWEYCAISCPYFDLASCIKVNGLEATDQASLCAYYAQYTELHLSEVVNKVKTMQPLVDFTYTLWYQSASIVS